VKWTIVWTARADSEAARAVVWWAKNRPAAPRLLRLEIAEAIDLVRGSPMMGAVHKPGVRRLVLEQTRYLIFYSLDVEAAEIRIHAVWSSLRGKAPRLRGV
jgi:plasmid stabilization system protein ParE